MKDIGNGYFAVESGEIWSAKTNKYISKRVSIKGYYLVNLSINGKCKTFSLHRLIAKAFIPNLNNLPEINHKDGNKLNNNIDNLEWCTAAENVKHAFDTGLMHPARGIRVNNGRFTEEDIRSIRSLISNKIFSCGQVAKLYNVTKAAIQQIIWRKTYNYIT